jgi:hypothetical protein
MSSSLACRECGKPIKFDDKHVSQKTGKKIPLDVATNEPHDCPARKAAEFPAAGNSSSSQSPQQEQQTQQQRRYHQCNKGCGSEIYFHDSRRTENGEWIPLDKRTGQPHRCQ